MTDKDVPASKPLNEFTIGEFAGVFLGLLKHYDDVKNLSGTGQIGNMSMKDFQDLMLQTMDSQRYKLAQAEAEISKRIFSDTQALATAGTAFRVTSLEDLDKFVANNKAILDGRRELILVMAIRDGATGAYATL